MNRFRQRVKAVRNKLVAWTENGEWNPIELVCEAITELGLALKLERSERAPAKRKPRARRVA